jgi:uncharacterized membrane protein
MLGLTTLGAVHTAISLIALGTGIFALASKRIIKWNSNAGKLYVITTVLTCLTGFGIFQHGGFNKAHVLGIVTLLTIAVAWAAATDRFGKRSKYVEAISLSLTIFFHFIPGITETSLRLPLGAPLAKNTEEPWLQTAAGILFLLFLIGAVLQIRMLRSEERKKSGVPFDQKLA